jgi:prepilin-type N-terminal cleavage/methylation domain-containing protein
MKRACNQLTPICGFTLVEILLVVAIFGAILSVVLPRALRVTREAKFGQVRQYASEIGGYMVQWAETQAMAQREDSPYSLRDYFQENINPEISGIESNALVNKYTGHHDFDRIKTLMPLEKLPQNPFNGTSYFSSVNDDPVDVPSKKPALIYFASAVDPVVKGQAFRNFHLLLTGFDGQWYGDMDHKDPDALRRGIFVARFSDVKPESLTPIEKTEQ